MNTEEEEEEEEEEEVVLLLLYSSVTARLYTEQPVAILPRSQTPGVASEKNKKKIKKIYKL